MRYTNLSTTPKTTTPTYRARQQQEITAIAWEVEGGVGPYALTWRVLAERNGIFDPVQIAGEVGRALLGQALTPALRLKLEG